MSDLVEFLRARLAEDEQAARRAGETFRQIGETGVIVATEGDRAEECASANWTGVAEHIVRHDPVRVLREVEVGRRLIKRYERVTATPESASGFVRGQDDGYRQACLDAIKDAAEVYADHPEYDERWRP